MMSFEIIVLGTSTGGLRALRSVLGGLPGDLSVPMAVVQHRHARADDALLTVLQPSAALVLVEPDDKEPLRPGHVYFAPPDYHLLVTRDRCDLCSGAAVRFARPSVDVLFESAADAFGRGVLAVVLTGANSDGLDGARRIRQLGGTVIAQDLRSTEAPQMPGAVIDAGLADVVLPLEEIAPWLLDLCAQAAEE